MHVPEATALHRMQVKGVSQQQQKAQLWHIPCTVEEQIQYILCSTNLQRQNKYML